MPAALTQASGASLRPISLTLALKQSCVISSPAAAKPRQQRLGCSAIAFDERTGTTSQAASLVPQRLGTRLDDAELLEYYEPEPEAVSDKELTRRKKISVANKGKTAWNKGKAHSEEVRARIRQRTFEAMQRPDVRARMIEANRHRPPHREEVKEKIRTVLRQRASNARTDIEQAATRIVAAMKESDDEEEREAANDPNVEVVVGRLAWRYVKRDYENTFQHWETNDANFRRAIIERIQELETRRRVRLTLTATGKPRKRSFGKTPGAKVRAAIAMQKKLLLAREKVIEAEAVLIKLQEAKVLYSQRSPQAGALVLEKEEQTRVVLDKLKAQVEELSDAIAPLQQYLDPSTGAMDFVVQQQEQHQLEHQDNNSSHTKTTATPSINAQQQQQQEINGNGHHHNEEAYVETNGAAVQNLNNGEEAEAAAGGAASPSRLPWRQ